MPLLRLFLARLWRALATECMHWGWPLAIAAVRLVYWGRDRIVAPSQVGEFTDFGIALDVIYWIATLGVMTAVYHGRVSIGWKRLLIPVVAITALSVLLGGLPSSVITGNIPRNAGAYMMLGALNGVGVLLLGFLLRAVLRALLPMWRYVRRRGVP